MAPAADFEAFLGETELFELRPHGAHVPAERGFYGGAHAAQVERIPARLLALGEQAADFLGQRGRAAQVERALPHAGIIVARQQSLSIGEPVRRLLRLMATLSADDMRNRVEFLGDWG